MVLHGEDIKLGTASQWIAYQFYSNAIYTDELFFPVVAFYSNMSSAVAKQMLWTMNTNTDRMNSILHWLSTVFGLCWAFQLEMKMCSKNNERLTFRNRIIVLVLPKFILYILEFYRHCLLFGSFLWIGFLKLTDERLFLLTAIHQCLKQALLYDTLLMNLKSRYPILVITEKP